MTHVSETPATTMKETSELKIFQRMTLRKIQGLIEESEGWKIRAKRKRKVILQTEGTIKFIKSLRLRWNDHVERIQNQRMAKQITTAEGIRKRERPRKRLRDEVEEYLNGMEMKQAGNGQRLPGIEEYFSGSQGPQRTVALEEEEEEEEEEEKEEKKKNKTKKTALY